MIHLRHWPDRNPAVRRSPASGGWDQRPDRRTRRAHPGAGGKL